MTAELAAQLERLGFGTLWLGSSPPGDLHEVVPLLEATSTLTVATGIVNIWAGDPHETAAAFARVEQQSPRTVRARHRYRAPRGHPGVREAVRRAGRYLDTLLTDGVPPDSIVLAALGPRVLELARDRTAGAHPYLVPPAHTRQAREILGAGKILAPEHKVVLDADAARARALGRSRVERPYLGLSNYTNNLRRLGWSEADIEAPGSDALIDALVAHGTDVAVRAQLSEHLDAGADHVAVQLITPSGADVPAAYEHLAKALQL